MSAGGARCLHVAGDEGWMGTRVSLNHQTNYKYDKRITLGPQIVRLRPAVTLPHAN